MKAQGTIRTFARKAVALATIASMTLGQVAHAVSTDIADVPMAVKNQVAPNIFFTLDDSGSMHWEFLPEEEMRFSLFTLPRGTNIYLSGSDYSNQTPNYNDGNLHNFFTRSSRNNKLYYNPDITYKPWSNSDGSLMADANPSAAYFNPGNTAAGTFDLVNQRTISAIWFSDYGDPGNINNAYCDPGCGVNHTFWPITYFIHTGGSVYVRANYTKVEITTATPASTTYTSPNGTVRTKAQEIQNFANWYQYYRSRVHMARAGIGRAFATVGTTPRVGFGTINQGSITVDGWTTPGAIVLGVRPFTGSERTNWFNNLYQQNIPTSNTPLRRAMDDVGQYFSRTDDQGPWGATPGSAGGTQHSCRQNYHILMTDGYWNGAQAPTSGARNNNDGSNGPTHTQASTTVSYTYTAAAPFTDVYSDTLADVAMYYWSRDLRSDMQNDVQGNLTDDAFWQHVTTYTVALGLSGTIPQGKVQFMFAGIRTFTDFDKNRDGAIQASEAAGNAWITANFASLDANADAKISISEFLPFYDNFVIAQLDTNADSTLSAAESAGFAELAAWFTSLDTDANGQLSSAELTINITWPDPTAASPNRLDDLAHAALNGRGGFFSASDPDTFASALSDTLNDIAARTGAAAAVAVANPNVVGGDNASYASKYNSGTWTGDLEAFPIDLTTGEPNISTPIWTTSAQTQLNGRTPTDRRIASYTGTSGTAQGIQFRPTSATTTTKLSATQQNLLNTPVTPPGPSDGAAVLDYLRGVRTGETAGTYRSRAFVLGDIINAEPLVVREPSLNYADDGYSSYKSLNSTRTRIVVQGANDGMLHAFNAASGAEEWAYVPNLLLSGLNNLSRKNGFAHKFLVDGTPVVGDYDTNNTYGAGGAAVWKTLLVGGFGKGGRGYYALDLTTTTAGDEAALTNKVLWEFPNSATSAADRLNMGYGFGRPIIVKTSSRGWVVLVASGYNNGTNSGDSGGDGQGWLYVLNARTGAVIKSIPTGVGSVSDPSGLAHISAYVEAGEVDNTVTHVYGGDLKGNVWRFDLTATNPNSWDVKKIATLVDGSGNFQPVTTEPELAKVDTGGGAFKRFIYVGTGLYLGDSDVTGSAGANSHAAQTQTMYGLIDDLTNSPTITPLRSNLQQQVLVNNVDGSRTASSNAIDFSTKKGWFVDMPVLGERINTNPALALGALAFTTNIPSTNPCVPGGSSFFNVLDYKNGGFLTGSTVSWSSQSLGNTLASRVVLIKLPSGVIKALARKSDATTVAQTVPVPPSSTTVKRRSWRELLLQ